MVVWKWPNWQSLQLKTDFTIRRLTHLNRQAKNYKHDQILSTPTNINQSEPWSTKGNAESEPHLEWWKVEHAAAAPAGKQALTVIVVDVDGGTESRRASTRWTKYGDTGSLIFHGQQ
jgi:hypothetical protein